MELFKLLLPDYLYGVRSERQLERDQRGLLLCAWYQLTSWGELEAVRRVGHRSLICALRTRFRGELQGSG